MLPWDAEVSAQSRTTAADWLDRLGRFIEARPIKILLAILILISLLPWGDGQRLLITRDARVLHFFVVTFGLEVALRGLLLLRAGERRGTELFFLLFDLTAFLSLAAEAVALAHGQQLPPLLTLLRLARLLVLVRFARELARDVYLIVTRREQLLQFGLITFFVLTLSFVSALLLVHSGVRHQDDSGRLDGSLADAIWWSFRQLESADNLVKLVTTPWPLLLISFVLTVVGVFVISFLIGIGTNVVEQLMLAERRRPVGYRGHALVIGPVEHSELLVREFVSLYDKNRMMRRVGPREVLDWLLRGGPRPRRHALPRMVLLGLRDEPPAYLYEEMMRWVVYRQGDGSDPEALRLVGGAHAKRVILLSRADAGADADAVSVASLAALRAENPYGHVFVEVQEGHNRALVEDVGGPGTFCLDAPRMAGLFLCQQLVVPGVDQLYRELTDNLGSEFYTHIYVDPRELAGLRRRGPSMPFARLAAQAYRQHQVVLTGVFLGHGAPPPMRGNLVPMEGLVQWANPLVMPADPHLQALGAAPGQVPLAALRGLIGVCTSYRPLRRYGRDLAMERSAEVRSRERVLGAAPGPQSARPDELQAALAACAVDMGNLRRMLLCGFSPALASLIAELGYFVPGVEALIVLGERDDEHYPLQRKLAQLGLGIAPGERPGEAGVRAQLPRGGSATIYTHEGANLADFAVRRLRAPVDAAVFFSEPNAADRDARTGMRVLRFAEALEAGAAPRGERLHLLAEFVSSGKGERIRRLLRRRCCGFSDESHLRVTILSTEHIKNYFMVRSAFVPGLTALFTELLAAEGQSLYRLAASEALGRIGAPIGLEAVRAALVPSGQIPLALELSDGRVLLNPPPEERFPADAIRGLYVLRSAVSTTASRSS